MENINFGVYPTMITPFCADGTVDYEGAKRILNWYIEKGCQGVFAVCQSSEMHFLSLDEKVKLAKTIVSEARGRISVVASGHNADSVDEQVREAVEISRTGVDAFVLVSNRFDLHNDGDAVWIKNAENFLSRIPEDIKLGIYECPMPYKRLLTPKLIDFCLDTKRFCFIKDTCCSIELLSDRLKQLENTELGLFNANAQTLLYTLERGGAGYSGIMANFHPELYVWLCDNFKKQPEKAKKLQAFLTMYAFSECLAYPITGKYRLDLEGLDINLYSRWKSEKLLKEYDKYCVRQGMEIEEYIKELLEI